jgi:hypothetical protein
MIIDCHILKLTSCHVFEFVALVVVGMSKTKE